VIEQVVLISSLTEIEVQKSEKEAPIQAEYILLHTRSDNKPCLITILRGITCCQ